MIRRVALPLAALLLVAAGDPTTETEHVVAEGETLSGIANRAGVPMAAIAQANGLAEPYIVKVGQKLVIPRQRVHVVEKGDTGFSIAYKYGVPFELIARANGIDDDAVLRIGRRLIIPAVLDGSQPVATTMQAAAPPKELAFRRPHEGEVILGWKRRPDGTGHEGLDFKVKLGDAVRAAAAGTVIYAAEEPERFGRLVVIDHGNGWHTAYGHLEKLTVKKGEKVRAGERIGLAGASGVATEPELHFEIRHDGQPIDPAPKLGLEQGE